MHNRLYYRIPLTAGEGHVRDGKNLASRWVSYGPKKQGLPRLTNFTVFFVLDISFVINAITINNICCSLVLILFGYRMIPVFLKISRLLNCLIGLNLYMKFSCICLVEHFIILGFGIFNIYILLQSIYLCLSNRKHIR